MITELFSTAGIAVYWRVIQYGGEKVIFLVRLVVLARLLKPFDFGLLAIASLAIDVLMRLSNLGMSTALVQLEEASTEHYDSAWTIDVLRAIIVAVIIFFASPLIADYLIEPQVVNILRVLSLRPILDASASTMITKFSRDLDFRTLVFLQLPKALVNTFLSIILANRLGVWALVVGNLVGSLVFLVQSYILAPHRPRWILQFDPIRPLARFGRWVLMTSIVAMVSQTILRVAISRQLGATELGLYYLAASLAFMPTDIANQIIGPVAFSFYSRIQKNYREVTAIFKSIFLSVAVLLLPVSILMIAVTPTLVNDIFGLNWMGTVDIIRVLLIVNIFDVLGETISPILNGTGHPNKILVMESIQSIIVITIVTSLTKTYGVIGAAIAGLPSTLIAQIAGLYFLRDLLEKPFSGLQKPLLTILLVSILGALVAVGIDYLIAGWIGFILASLLGLSLVGSSLWLIESRYSIGMLEGFQRAFPSLFIWIGLKQAKEW